MNKLSETQDFLELYMHHAGRSMVPAAYHSWCGLALIAAAVADRVYYCKFADKRMAPNLYTFLVGPSGVGKGEAIDCATKFIPRVSLRVPFFDGKLTAAALVDLLAGKRKLTLEKSSHLFLATPELTQSLGIGPLARDFITFMTRLYTGAVGPVRDYTRTHGMATVHTPPCINWLAGTTERWMVESITPADVESGFMARTAIVVGHWRYDPDLVDPIYPEDREEVKAHLQSRVRALTYLQGQMHLTESAAAVRREWFRVRSPHAHDPRLMPWFQREDDLALKLGMLFSLSAGTLDLLIHRDHIARGQRLAEQLTDTARRTLTFARAAGDSPAVAAVKEIILARKQLSRSVLVRKAMGRGGIDSVKRFDEVVTMLEKGGFVQSFRTSTGAKFYALVQESPLGRGKP